MGMEPTRRQSKSAGDDSRTTTMGDHAPAPPRGEGGQCGQQREGRPQMVHVPGLGMHEAVVLVARRTQGQPQQSQTHQGQEEA